MKRSELSSVAQIEVDGLRRLVDEMHLQAVLGMMESRDRIAGALDRAQRRIDRIRHDLEDVSQVVDSEELDRDLIRAMKDLRQEVATAEELR